MIGILIYGMVRFPDSPIHPCTTHGYCGKQGQPHTVFEYLAFDQWITTMYYLWPTGVIALILLRRRIDQNSTSKM
jgi:hypothetical protein